MVYLSGHGVAFGDTYAYPTADANTIDPADFSRDSQLLSETARLASPTGDQSLRKLMGRTHNPPAFVLTAYSE